MSHHPWIPLATRRAEAVLTDGSSCVLVGVERAPSDGSRSGRLRSKGHRVRVEFPGGRRRTIPMTDVVWVDTDAADRTDVSGNLEATAAPGVCTSRNRLTPQEPSLERLNHGG